MSTPTPFLNVARSLGRARWVLAQDNPDLAARMTQVHGLPDIVARILTSRGVGLEDAPSFLEPTLRRDFPDPLSLQGMKDAADHLAQAIESGAPLGVFADFDVDGATSAALLTRFLRHLGREPILYIPDRLKEGYGPNAQALQTLRQKGVALVILCDCGTTSHGVLEEARDMGLETIVLDHHEPDSGPLPCVTHLINPKRTDDSSGLDMLAACGVTFLMCVATNAALRARGFFTPEGRTEPPLRAWLDIVALGTICDMVPLRGPNRLFVRHGLEQMSRTGVPGLKALCEVARVCAPFTPYHAGFALGPRINAGSRVHKADLGARLLGTDDYEEALGLAMVLDESNEVRKRLQRDMTAQAMEQVCAKALDRDSVIFVSDPSWHPGLAGLVAGHLKEVYGKPACVTAFADMGGGLLEGRGSGRSVPGINLAAAFLDARAQGLILKGGGHAMAGGYTIAPDRVEDFRAFVNDHVFRQLAGSEPTVFIAIDALLSVRGAQVDLVRLIHNRLGPFGEGHPEPVFVLPHVQVRKADIIGDGHVRAMVSDPEGGPWMKVMAFRGADTEPGRALLTGPSGPKLHLAGTLKIDDWSGQEKVEMHLRDASFTESDQNARPAGFSGGQFRTQSV